MSASHADPYGQQKPTERAQAPLVSPSGLHTRLSPRRFEGHPLRVLIIPGLGGSDRYHWQSWLQGQYHRAARVMQSDWDRPDLPQWADAIDAYIDQHPRTHWIAAAHSFGCLALAHHLQRRHQAGEVSNIRGALLVAPADPSKFDVEPTLEQGGGLKLPATVVGSDTDPWMSPAQARRWADHWGANFQNLGDAGHINVASGHGPWPLARHWVDQLIRDQYRRRRLSNAHVLEFSFAV